MDNGNTVLYGNTQKRESVGLTKRAKYILRKNIYE